MAKNPISSTSDAQASRANKRTNQARAILDAARAQAADIRAQAEAKKTELVSLGNSQGMEEGLAQAEHMRQQLDGLEHRMLNEVNTEAIRTSVGIAQKILVQAIERRPETAVDVAVAALKQTSDAREVFLRVHPSMVETMQTHKRRLVDTLSMAKDVVIRMDRNVPVGGVLIQTESGVIDATLETQLDELARVLGA